MMHSDTPFGVLYDLKIGTKKPIYYVNDKQYTKFQIIKELSHDYFNDTYIITKEILVTFKDGLEHIIIIKFTYTDKFCSCSFYEFEPTIYKRVFGIE